MKIKDKLRQKLKTKRLALAEGDAKEAGENILNTLSKELDWNGIKSLNSYTSVAQWREVDTRPLLEYIWQYWPNIQSTTMRVDEGGQMKAIIINPDTKWTKHEWGMPEPENEDELPDTHQFDVIIVPVLGFDKQNNRLGLGMGYYDRFLKEQRKAQKIGLAYSWAYVESLPYESHDIKLDRIITET